MEIPPASGRKKRSTEDEHTPAQSRNKQRRCCHEEASSSWPLERTTTAWCQYRFVEEISPALMKFMKLRSRSYVFRGKVIGTKDDVRRWLCVHALPRESNDALTAAEHTMLTQWASLANVKLNDIQGGKLCCDGEIIALLAKAGLSVRPNGSFVAGPGNAEFDDLCGVRLALRTHGLSILPRTAGVHNLSDSERASLRLWAVAEATSWTDAPWMISPRLVSPEAPSDAPTEQRTPSRADTNDNDDGESESEEESGVNFNAAVATPCRQQETVAMGRVVTSTRPATRHAVAYTIDPLVLVNDLRAREEILLDCTGSYNFNRLVFPVLNKVFDYSQNIYRWQGVALGSEEAVRQWICVHGVPSDNLTDAEVTFLHVWASYAQVKLRSDLNHLVNIYSDNQIKEVLRSLHVHRQEDGTFRTNRRALGSLEDIARLFCTEGPAAISRSAFAKLSEEEQSNLRLWAARTHCLTIRKFEHTLRTAQKVNATANQSSLCHGKARSEATHDTLTSELNPKTLAHSQPPASASDLNDSSFQGEEHGATESVDLPSSSTTSSQNDAKHLPVKSEGHTGFVAPRGRALESVWGFVSSIFTRK